MLESLAYPSYRPSVDRTSSGSIKQPWVGAVRGGCVTKAKATATEAFTDLEGLDENTTIYSYSGLRLWALPEVDERIHSVQEVEICRQKNTPYSIRSQKRLC
jgi:hypothetical protein